MTLNELIKYKTETGKMVQFSKGHSKTGLVIIVTSLEDKKKYVLEKSTKDYSRFEDWIEKQTRADIKRTGKFFKTKDYGKLPLIQIRVKVDDEDQDINTTNKEMVF